MVRPAQGALRQDLLTIVRAGIDAASAARALARVLDESALSDRIQSNPVHVIAAGKAAAEMMQAWCAVPGLSTRSALAIGTHRHVDLPGAVEWHEAGHPLPDERSVRAAARALRLARSVPFNETLVILLSGGASALMALPLEGITLFDKQRIVDALLKGGADIHALNTVRKHLSAVKGGRLAVACAGNTITLAISDVVGDDLAVIGSGPGVVDPSTWHDAYTALNRHVAERDQPTDVRRLLEEGLAGRRPDTPKPDDQLTSRLEARVIAGRFDAMDGARKAAEQLGYDVRVVDAPVTGEARTAAAAWFERVKGHRGCVICSGETTVRVTGSGKGGRNQEFALALAERIAGEPRDVAVTSIGTDGIDGPTNAAGAIVDRTTLQRARERGLSPSTYLSNNDSYAFFRELDDLLVTGPTGTNVGDLQIFLTADT